MAGYSVLVLENMIKTFSMVGSGQDCNFTFSVKGQVSPLESISTGDKIIGYVSSPKEMFCYIFEVKEITAAGDYILVKEYEATDGFLLENAKQTVKDIILGTGQINSFINITKEIYNYIIKNMLKCVVEKYKDIGTGIRFKTGLVSEFERNRIVFGAPGTGKSHKLKKDSETLRSGTSGTYERVTFHPDYAYAHFVGTYKPITDDSSSEIKYEFVPGPFIRVYVEALRSGRTDSPQPHLLLIEEINRAKVAAVFGDVFQLLDRDDDDISEYEIHASEDIRKHLAKELGGEPDSYQNLKLPDNMFIWATMNSADQGVFPMDTAFKRRWNFEYLGIDENYGDIKGKIILGTGSHELEVKWNQLRKAINEKLTEEYKINEDKLIGPYFLSKKVIKTVSDTDDTIDDHDKFKDAFKNKVIMYLYEDAAKQHKHKLFDGCSSAGYSTAKYSSVCEAFDEIGVDIFGDGFRELYDNQGA